MTDKRPSWAPTAMIFHAMMFNVVDKVVDVVVDVEFFQPSDVFQIDGVETLERGVSQQTLVNHLAHV